MHLETILIRYPDGTSRATTIEVQDHENTEQIAVRQAVKHRLPRGATIAIRGQRLGVLQDGGAKVAVCAPVPNEDPSVRKAEVKRLITSITQKVSEASAYSPPGSIAGDDFRPGDMIRPRDPRRKSGFRIKAVWADHIEGEDGRHVSLDRLKRYERVK